MRDCLSFLSRGCRLLRDVEKSVCLPYIWGRLLLYEEESASALYIGSIFLYEGENVTESASPLSDADSLYMKMKVSLVSIAGAESLSMERRVCLSSLWRHSSTSSLYGGYTLLFYRAVVSYLQSRCHRRSLVSFS